MNKTTRYGIASRKRAIDTSDKIKKLTGFDIPEFDVIEYKSSEYTFFGDFAIKITLDNKSKTGQVMLFNGLMPAS